eukprot:945738-Amphidinium_carterae.1
MGAAAIPVDAVTATREAPCLSFNVCTRCRSKKLFPVPAAPVKKRFLPLRTFSAAACCSGVNR